MNRHRRSTLAAFVVAGASLTAQAPAVAPTNDAPNPYTTQEGWAKMPAGRTWGSTSAVDIDPDGRSIWVAERCGANRCWLDAEGKASPLDVVLKFDANGNLVRSFAQGMIASPHGIHIDRDGNVWVTDWQDNLPRRARGAVSGGGMCGSPPRVCIPCRGRLPPPAGVYSAPRDLCIPCLDPHIS